MDFANELAERVQAVVPEGFAVVAENGSVRVSRGDDYGASTGVAMIVGSHDRVEGMATAASAVLNSVQDYISKELHEPWPSGGERFAMPKVTVEGTTLSMWFGEQECPALAVSDIDSPSCIRNLRIDEGRGHQLSGWWPFLRLPCPSASWAV